MLRFLAFAISACMSDNNIVAEFNNLGVLAQKLEDTGMYDVGIIETSTFYS